MDKCEVSIAYNVVILAHIKYLLENYIKDMIYLRPGTLNQRCFHNFILSSDDVLNCRITYK
jgi:hypothetical protein